MKIHKSEKVLYDKLLSNLGNEAALAADMSALIAGRIDYLLRTRGMSHKDLAAATSHTQGVVSRWLSGHHNFTLNTIAKISAALGHNLLDAVTPSYQ